jgi:hypothetical protein
MLVIVVNRVVDKKRINGKNGGGPRRRRGTRGRWPQKNVSDGPYGLLTNQTHIKLIFHYIALLCFTKKQYTLAGFEPGYSVH